ncbi:MAG: hypothetical protein L6Q98_18915 [Anaerolineae bacterium]|nr:hypothetical protein [Anaerolineae bacterium]NUQ05433.1 hypothetical protein [Anaerolineae bacterium]
MRSGTAVLAGLMIVVGAIWSLQGAGILPGSFMSGDPRWLVIGIVVIVLGAGILLVSRRRAAKP